VVIFISKNGQKSLKFTKFSCFSHFLREKKSPSCKNSDKKKEKKKKTIWDVMLISILGVDLVLVKP